MADDVSTGRLDQFRLRGSARVDPVFHPGANKQRLERNGMARCFLTGVEFPLQQAFVLNRRGARDLLHELQDRIASLQRVIEQLSPLDPHQPRQSGGKWKDVPKRHRLVCKAVADVLALGFPEIGLFQSWPDYRSQARMARRGVDDGAADGKATPQGTTGPPDGPRP